MKSLRKILFILLYVGLAFSGYAQRASGTLPVVYINTENHKDITSKDEYLTADCWVDPRNTGFVPIGSESEPVLLQIKGRGNYTWIGFDKKPYRLKFDKKQEMLGMKKSKHFVLLAHADDELGFMRNTTGFELSRRLGLPWTPSQQPVELVLNGDYRGLYFLTENIRVDEDRVNIVEQPDLASDPTEITGGWLVEIDNYDTDPHVTIYDDGGRWGTNLFFTYKTPEELSSEQEKYLKNQMQMLNDMFVSADKSVAPWTEFVDLDQLVRYYIVQEILDDAESFHGSCYLYKDLGEGEKWKFGPVWDFGNSFRRGDSRYFIYERSPFGQAWIGEIAKFDVFQQKLREVWAEFMESDFEGLDTFLKKFTNEISEAARSDYNRWPNYGNRDILSDYDQFTGLLYRRVKWLGEQWDRPYEEPVPDPSTTLYLRGEFNNWNISHPFILEEDGLYYVRDISTGISQFKIADEKWGYYNFGSNGEEVRIGEEYDLNGATKENIIPAESLDDVDFVFDLTNCLLLVRKAEKQEPEPQPEITVYLRGDFNNWGITHPFTKKDDGLHYVIDVTTSVGEGRFKVADAEWRDINLGSNGEPLYIGEPYEMVAGTNDNIYPAQYLESMDFILDLDRRVLTVRKAGAAGISDYVADGIITISDKTVMAPGPIRIYDTTGRLLQQGENILKVSSSGLLIVVTPEKVLKHIF